MRRAAGGGERQLGEEAASREKIYVFLWGWGRKAEGKGSKSDSRKHSRYVHCEPYFFILGIILLDVFVALCVRLYPCAVGSFSVPWIQLEKLMKAFVLSIMRHQRHGLQFGFDSVYVFFH